MGKICIARRGSVWRNRVRLEAFPVASTVNALRANSGRDASRVATTRRMHGPDGALVVPTAECRMHGDERRCLSAPLQRVTRPSLKQNPAVPKPPHALRQL